MPNLNENSLNDELQPSPGKMTKEYIEAYAKREFGIQLRPDDAENIRAKYSVIDAEPLKEQGPRSVTETLSGFKMFMKLALSEANYFPAGQKDLKGIEVPIQLNFFPIGYQVTPEHQKAFERANANSVTASSETARTKLWKQLEKTDVTPIDATAEKVAKRL